MPSVLPPKLRWKPTALPLLELGLDPIERAQRIIAGSLTLWASRSVGFNWADHIETEMVFRYCVARINGDREAARPTTFQLRTCLAEVGDHIDAEAYKALNILALSIDAGSRKSRHLAEQSTDFFGLDGNPLPDEGDEDAVDDIGANDYGVFGEPPEAKFANSAPPETRPGRGHPETRPTAPAAQPSARPLEVRRQGPGRPVPIPEPADSLQDARDAQEAREADDNPSSRLEQMAANLRALVRTKRTQRPG